MAKPIEGVAGSGEHTHVGVAARLKDGTRVNLFTPRKPKEDYLSAVGFGALLGILKNYEIINPFITSSNDAFNRLKPGFEAPVCIVTSVGHHAEVPGRNRTVLLGLVRDATNPLATRFELRSPNPKSNTYLVLATVYMAMLDGIKAALEGKKTSKDLLAILSKKYGEEVYYLEKDREYRSELDVFEAYSEEERSRLFGKVPRTVAENLRFFDAYPEKLEILKVNDVFDEITLESYKEAVLGQWATELRNRIIPNVMDTVRECKKLHIDVESTDLDLLNWKTINTLRVDLGQDCISSKCLLTRIKTALDEENYDAASLMQLEMQEKIQKLIDVYIEYKKNLF
jgi:glutamine synthetase